MTKDPERDVAEGIVLFAKALIRDHHVDRSRCLRLLSDLIDQERQRCQVPS